MGILGEGKIKGGIHLRTHMNRIGEHAEGDAKGTDILK